MEKYQENNPLSEMGFLLLRDLEVLQLKKFTEPNHFLKRKLDKYMKDSQQNVGFNLHNTLNMDTVKESDPLGQISLHKGLDLAYQMFQDTPLYYHKEVYLILGSVNTNDQQDLFELIKKFKEEQIRISIISLSGNTYIFDKIVKQCQGKIAFPQNKDDLEDYLFVYQKGYSRLFIFAK